jgi:PEP-CTERM motif
VRDHHAALLAVTGTTVKINFTFASSVPEPASALLVGCGLISLVLARRKAA